MGEGVAEEGHAAQNDIGAHDGAQDADDGAGEEGADHEVVLERGEEEGHVNLRFQIYDLRLFVAVEEIGYEGWRFAS